MTDLPPNGKLVRDGIPDLIRAEGGTPRHTRLAADQRLAALLAKLREEADELAAADGDDRVGELGDVLEVVRALADEIGVSWAEVEAAADAKRAARGGFAEGWWWDGNTAERPADPSARLTTSGMRYVGVDLAWGPNATTGLAVLDDQGRLLDVTDARTDEQIEAWLHDWAPADCLVAFDAPLIVRNASGRRSCETLVSRHFGRFHAACHSSSLSRPEFADGGRALRLASRSGLDPDPASEADRRAVEVYPHPALVSLFELPRILRYKNKKGRDLDFRRRELTRLLDHLEDLETARPAMSVRQHEGWLRIRASVRDAARKADLDRVEDSIDAVVCAYIALHFDAAPDGRRILGTYYDGYIVTPVTPEIAAAIDAG